jgi:hypothetical protein
MPDFRGQQRRNATHASTTDGDARLWRKGHGQEIRKEAAAIRREIRRLVAPVPNA